MNEDLLNKINHEIFQHFPQVLGSVPEQVLQPNQAILLIYRGTAKTEDGHSLPIIVRVVVDQSGKILKTTTSR